MSANPPPDEQGSSEPTGESFVAFAVLFEMGIGGSAFLLALFFGGSPLDAMRGDTTDAGTMLIRSGIGLAATLPLLAAFLALDRSDWVALRQIKETLDRVLLPPLASAGPAGLAAVSLAAGFGEELLFRGWLQPRIAEVLGYPWGLPVGVVVAALVFGVCHWVTPLYGILAAAIGLYLGYLAVASEGILAPSVCHAAYDFVVLWILTRRLTA